jgi:hypothetical protein
MLLAFSALRHAGWQFSIHVLPVLVQHLCQRAVYGHIVPPHQRDKAMRFLLLVALILSPSGLYAATKGNLENPQPDDYASGIYLISGWVCDAERVEILLDGAQYLAAPYGSERMDTVSQCGDSDNGFGVLINMANLGAGEHEASLIADGQVIDTHTFKVTALSTGEFADDLSGCAVIEDFPADKKETRLEWTTSMQGFQMSEETDVILPYKLDGAWEADYWDAYLWTYRSSCDAVSVYLRANLSDASGAKEYVKLAGEVDGASFVLKSTPQDVAVREAELTISSSQQIKLVFTSCGPDVDKNCNFTQVGGTVILTKVPNVMDPESLPIEN